jgi:hypothetical protein
MLRPSCVVNLLQPRVPTVWQVWVVDTPPPPPPPPPSHVLTRTSRVCVSQSIPAAALDPHLPFTSTSTSTAQNSVWYVHLSGICSAFRNTPTYQKISAATAPNCNLNFNLNYLAPQLAHGPDPPPMLCHHHSIKQTFSDRVLSFAFRSNSCSWEAFHWVDDL